MLSQLFDHHPQVHAHPDEITIGKPRKWNWPDIDVRHARADAIFWSLYEHHLNRHIRYGYWKGPASKRSPGPWDFSRSHQRRVFLECWKRRTSPSQRDAIDCYFTSYFNAWQNYAIADRVADADVRYLSGFIPRLNMHADSMARFVRDYPDGRLISIVRDPAGWYASAARHADMYRDLDSGLELWARSARASMRMASEHPDSVRVVIFRDLVLDTERVMRDLVDWLGLDWDPIAVEPTFNGHPIKANTRFSSPSSGMVRETASRRDQLPRDIADTIDARVGPVYADALAFRGS